MPLFTFRRYADLTIWHHNSFFDHRSMSVFSVSLQNPGSGALFPGGGDCDGGMVGAGDHGRGPNSAAARLAGWCCHAVAVAQRSLTEG